MRNIRLSSLLLVALAALLLVAPVAAQETVDDVIAKNIEARGGMDAINKVESAVIKGAMAMGGMEMPFTITWKRPNMVRMDFEMQGMTGTQAYDGEQAWMQMPFGGNPNPEPMPDSQIDQVKEMADWIEGPLINYKDKGHTVELVGKEDVDGTEAYKLKITHTGGRVVESWIDAEYFLEFQQKSEQDMMGQKVTMLTTFGDFKEVAGVMLPHAFDNMAEGAAAGQSFLLKEIEIGADVDAAVFTMPEAKDDHAGHAHRH